MNARSLGWGLLGALPILVVLSLAVPSHVRELTDPCTTFGSSSGSSVMTPDDPCSGGRTSITNDRATHIAIILFIDLTLALSAALFLIAGARGHGGLFAIGSGVLVLPTAPLLLGFASLMAIPSILLGLIAARIVGPWRGWPRIVGTTIAALLLVGATYSLVEALASGDLLKAPATAIVALAAALALAWVVFWPARPVTP